jgi:hypothetical protein
VSPESAPAPAAASAGEVDLADDTLSEERGAGGTLDAPDELVPGDAGKGVVSAEELEVRIADPGGEHANQDMSPARRRLADVAN